MKIEYFKELLTLVEQENYFLAAEALHLSQSTLSRHMMITEQYFGVEIFNREAKHFSITKKGEHILRYAAEIVELYEDYLRNVKPSETEKTSGEDMIPSPGEQDRAGETMVF